jgi:hypothetical protein
MFIDGGAVLRSRRRCRKLSQTGRAGAMLINARFTMTGRRSATGYQRAWFR